MANSAAPGDANFLQVERLTKRFDEVAAVDEVSLSIARGEMSRCSARRIGQVHAAVDAGRFRDASAGSIRLEGVEISKLRPYERPIKHDVPVLCAVPHLTVTRTSRSD